MSALSKEKLFGGPNYEGLLERHVAERRELKRLGLYQPLLCQPILAEALKRLQGIQCRYCRYWTHPPQNSTKKHLCSNEFSEYAGLFCKPRFGCQDFIDRRPGQKGKST